jgi:hypothetical protein
MKDIIFSKYHLAKARRREGNIAGSLFFLFFSPCYTVRMAILYYIFLTLFDIFRFLLLLIVNGKRLKKVLFIQYKTIRTLARILEQKGVRVTFKPHEQFLIAAVFDGSPQVQKYFPFASPNIILTKWKNAVACFWTHPRKKKGRPPLSEETKQLILKMKKENPSWGCHRIRDELKKLSIDVSHETINKVIQHFMKTGDIKPAGSWKTFISSHLKVLFACDYLTVTLFGMVTLYVFFIIKLETREIIRFGVTATPDIKFLRNQLSDFEHEHPGAYLIHDNSGELRNFPYKQYNFKDVAIVPYTPNMNAYAERFVRSIRQECLNYFIIFTYGQLYRLVKAYVDYYNNYRPHQGLKGRIPKGSPEPVQKTGAIKQKSLLFGLHHHYYREAA